jgi:hypothetical protein
MTALPPELPFLSGEHGHVGGFRRTLARRAGDRALDAWLAVSGAGRSLDRLAESTPAREVLVAGVYRPESDHIEPAVDEMRKTKHALRLALGSTGAARPPLMHETLATDLGGGKFENLNTVLAERRPADWLIVVDDDVRLPRRFLDRFIALCEHFRLELAQPAQSLASQAAWRALRRQPRSLLRETGFVEIGPVTGFSRQAADTLLPFPPLRFGWGLDAHWAALASERGWRLGVADALPVRHESRRVGESYDTSAAVAEAQRFLADRPWVDSARALETVAMHRRL